MTNIVERLRVMAEWKTPTVDYGCDPLRCADHSKIEPEAADEIERLRALNNALLGDREQPVAWRCVADDGVSDVTEVEGVADQWRSDGFAVAPLYAAPQHQEGE